MNTNHETLPQDRLVLEGRQQYSSLSVVYENAVIVALIGFGAALMSSVRLFDLPVLSLGFLLYCAVMLGHVLRRQLCSRCYYYGRQCHCGWGKYAALVVQKAADATPTTSQLAPAFWFSAMGLPPIALGVSLALSLTTWSNR